MSIRPQDETGPTRPARTPPPRSVPSADGVPSATGASATGASARLAGAGAETGTDVAFAPGPASLESFHATPVPAGDETPMRALIDAVRELESRSTGWFTKLLIMAGSMVMFVALGMAFWSARLVWMLVAVLLVHEAGHYVAMRVFGYRNVKMFFIPMLGAAVSGRHFHIAAWKKALVYLAGPVPGILLSFPLMFAGVIGQQEWMLELGGLALVLNLLNLLPLMPLDGGWIMHLTVFSRSPWLELIARLAAIAVMVAAAIWMQDRVLLFIAIPLLLSLPTTFRIARLIRRMRNQRIAPPTHDQIPESAIWQIADQMRSTRLAMVPVQQKARLVVQVYEALVVQPPGVASTLAIWAVYFGTFVLATSGGILMVGLVKG